MKSGTVYDVEVRPVVNKDWTTTRRLRYVGLSDGRTMWTPDINWNTKTVFLTIDQIVSIEEVTR